MLFKAMQLSYLCLSSFSLDSCKNLPSFVKPQLMLLTLSFPFTIVGWSIVINS